MHWCSGNPFNLHGSVIVTVPREDISCECTANTAALKKREKEKHWKIKRDERNHCGVLQNTKHVFYGPTVEICCSPSQIRHLKFKWKNRKLKCKFTHYLLTIISAGRWVRFLNSTIGWLEVNRVAAKNKIVIWDHFFTIKLKLINSWSTSVLFLWSHWCGWRRARIGSKWSHLCHISSQNRHR